MAAMAPLIAAALEVAEAVHEVPVALDGPRVLAHEVAGEGLDGRA